MASAFGLGQTILREEDSKMHTWFQVLIGALLFMPVTKLSISAIWAVFLTLKLQAYDTLSGGHGEN
jgi:hypothetical protein